MYYILTKGNRFIKLDKLEINQKFTFLDVKYVIKSLGVKVKQLQISKELFLDLDSRYITCINTLNGDLVSFKFTKINKEDEKTIH